MSAPISLDAVVDAAVELLAAKESAGRRVEVTCLEVMERLASRYTAYPSAKVCPLAASTVGITLERNFQRVIVVDGVDRVPAWRLG